MEALVTVQSTPTPAIVAGISEDSACWECGTHVPAPQRRHTLASIEAIICGNCEAWVRHTLGLDIMKEMHDGR